MEIKYVSDITGSGKTEYAINQIVEKCTEKFILVVPNKKLCSEISERIKLKSAKEKILIINQDTTLMTTKTFKEELLNGKYRIIITTHATFKNSLHDYNLYLDKNNWNLIIDEEFPLYFEHEINVSNVTIDIIKNYFTFEKNCDRFYIVKPKKHIVNYAIANDEIEDDFLKSSIFKDINRFVCSERFETLITSDIYNKVENNKTTVYHKNIKFLAVSIIKENFLEYFKSIFILSAFFEKTITYKILKKFDISFKKMSLSKNNKHNNSRLVTIHYFTERNWSATLRKKVHSAGMTYEQMIAKKIEQILKNKSYIYNSNRNTRNIFKKGTLVTSIHGVNEYKEYSNMVFMPSLNATASTINILSSFGLKRSDVDFSRNVLTAYQFISRGCVRTVNNKKRTNIIVMDERTMQFLKQVFPNAKIKFHSIEKKHKVIPSNIKSFVSRVRTRHNQSLPLTEKTITKYKKIIKEYYGNIDTLNLI